MDATSLNNLYKYLDGVLTAGDREWLASKLVDTTKMKNKTIKTDWRKEAKLSSRRKKIMSDIKIDPSNFETDERAKYILSK